MSKINIYNRNFFHTIMQDILISYKCDDEDHDKSKNNSNSKNGKNIKNSDSAMLHIFLQVSLWTRGTSIPGNVTNLW